MLFIAATVLAATSQSVEVFVAARALTGLAVASNVLNPAIVGDMFVSEQRGAAVSLVFLAPLIGGAVGPAISSAVAAHAGWRRVIWMSAALASVCEVVFLTFFRETYKVAILRKRAVKLGHKTARDDSGIVVFEGKRGFQELRDAVLRPAVVLLGSGVLQAMCLFGSVVFSYYYLMSVTLPGILLDVYQLDPVAAGLCFVSFSKSSPCLNLLSLTLTNLQALARAAVFSCVTVTLIASTSRCAMLTTALAAPNSGCRCALSVPWPCHSLSPPMDGSLSCTFPYHSCCSPWPSRALRCF